MSADKPKVLAQGDGGNKATLIASLLHSGLWDVLSINDREAWCERGQVLDTPGGRQLFAWLRHIRII